MSPTDHAKTLENDKSRQTWRSLDVMAYCVARRSPDRARLLALTALGSADERLAVKALFDDISACLPAGAKFKLLMVDVRGPTVRNYYIFASCLVDGGSLIDERKQGAKGSLLTKNSPALGTRQTNPPMQPKALGECRLNERRVYQNPKDF